jgi:peptidoglycan/LPS O-acetylase OafA/YrhL
MVDGVRLVVRGPLAEVVPVWSVLAAMLLPAAGLLLVCLSGAQARSARRLRLVTALVGTAVFGAMVWALTGLDPSRLGPGGVLASLGTLIVVTLMAPWWRPRLSKEF